MMRVALLISSVVAVFCLSACGDKLQSAGGVKNDVAPYQGVDNKFAVPGWKAGDKTSWEQALKARTHNTQNEYIRTATK
jgi:hypothetical protein